ncbi:hypothetical protein ACQ4PT_002856 [Festuca glaucescens]
MAKIKPKALLAQSKQKKSPTQIGVTRIITYIVLGALAVSSVYYAYQYWQNKGPAAAVAAEGIGDNGYQSIPVCEHGQPKYGH